MLSKSSESRTDPTKVISPNDHTNLSQSTNDAYPTFIHLGLYQTYLDLLPGLNKLIDAFKEKAVEFKNILKTGRTQMQDAVPMTMGQTFNGFDHSRRRVAEPQARRRAASYRKYGSHSHRHRDLLRALLPGIRTRSSTDLTGWNIEHRIMVGATSDTSHMIGFSQAMKRLAVKLSKISNDLPSPLKRSSRRHRNQPPRPPTGVVHYARQSEPRHPRSRHSGGYEDHRQ